MRSACQILRGGPLRRISVAVLGVLCLLTAVAVLLLRAPPTLKYGGKSVAAWAHDLEFGGSNPARRAEAERAFRAMGTNAIPALVHLLEQRDSVVSTTVGREAERLPRPLVRWVYRTFQPHDRAQRRAEAAMALAVLGPEALSAIPALEQALGDANPRVTGLAAEALLRLGEPARPALVRALGRVNDQNRIYVLGALARQPVGVEAIPTLVSLIGSSGSAVTQSAAQALKRAGPAALPPLLELLRDPESPEGTRAREALGTVVSTDYPNLQALIEAYPQHPPAVRRAVLEVISGETVFSRRLIVGMAAALADSDPGVRNVATTWLRGHTTLEEAEPLVAKVKPDALDRLRAALGPQAPRADRTVSPADAPQGSAARTPPAALGSEAD